jgi:hypothetical protein
MLLGKITSGGKYAPCIIGLSDEDYTSGQTELDCTAATATEVVRRVGSSGTLIVIGAPTATGVVAIFTATYSAVTIDGADSLITLADLGANIESGALICAADGSAYPLGILVNPDTGVKVVDVDANNIDYHLAELCIGGAIKASQIINYPAAANTTLRQFVKDAMNARTGITLTAAAILAGTGSGRCIFDDDY